MKKYVLIAALAALSGCLLVKDYGAAWSEAQPDACLSKIAGALYHSEFMRDPKDRDMDRIARGITLDGQHYLLLKAQEEDDGGRMYRFRVVNGIFQRLRLDPAMRHPFEVDHPNAPVEVKEDTVTLETLGKKERALLAQVAADEAYWEIEDQTLYNPMRNPACRFDDRDLAAKE